jgi:hypothetical protein
LEAEIKVQNDTLSSTMLDLERINHDVNSLYLSLESNEAILAEKFGENDDLNIGNWDLKSDKYLLELNNENLKKEVEVCRRNLERMERVNQDLWDTRDEVLQSAIKAEKLTKEQVEALSEALHALQEAAKHTKDAARATKTERESISSHGTKTQENLKREL